MYIYIYDDVQKVLSTRCHQIVEISNSFRHFLPTAFRLPSDTAAFLDVLHVTPPLASTECSKIAILWCSQCKFQFHGESDRNLYS